MKGRDKWLSHRSVAATVAGALLLTLAAGLFATPPQPPPRSEEAERLVALIPELEKKGDAEGLIQALKAAQALPRQDQGYVDWQILRALQKMDPAKIRRDEVVDLLRAEVAKGFGGALPLLAVIGTDRARAAVMDAARAHEDPDARRFALTCLARFKHPESTALLIDIACNVKETPELRYAGLGALQGIDLSEEQYRRVMKIAVDEPGGNVANAALEVAIRMGPAESSGVFGGSISDGGKPAAMGPLLEMLSTLLDRLEKLEKPAGDADARLAGDVSKTTRHAFSVLHGCMPRLAERAGYRVQFSSRLRVLKGDVEVTGYEQRTYFDDPAERRRVAEFWRTWWREHKDEVLREPTIPRADRPKTPPGPPGLTIATGLSAAPQPSPKSEEKTARDRERPPKEPAEVAYEEANKLKLAGKLAEAEKALRKVHDDYPGTHGAAYAMDNLWHTQALLGKTEEAFRTYVQFRQEDLAAAHEAVPTEGPALRQIQARARYEVAKVCRHAGDLAVVKKAVEQYVRLIEDYPEWALVDQARAELKELREGIIQWEIREKARAEIAVVMDKLNECREKKDREGFLALLSPMAREKHGAEYAKALLEDARFAGCRFRMGRVDFGKDNLSAWVEAEVIAPEPAEGRPTKVGFDLVRTPDGWKLTTTEEARPTSPMDQTYQPAKGK